MTTPPEGTGMDVSAEKRCNHWNDRADIDGRNQLRPLQCQGEQGHAGKHYAGGATWTEHYGFRGSWRDGEWVIQQ